MEKGKTKTHLVKASAGPTRDPRSTVFASIDGCLCNVDDDALFVIVFFCIDSDEAGVGGRFKLGGLDDDLLKVASESDPEGGEVLGLKYIELLN